MFLDTVLAHFRLSFGARAAHFPYPLMVQFWIDFWNRSFSTYFIAFGIQVHGRTRYGLKTRASISGWRLPKTTLSKARPRTTKQGRLKSEASRARSSEPEKRDMHERGKGASRKQVAVDEDQHVYGQSHKSIITYPKCTKVKKWEWRLHFS